MDGQYVFEEIKQKYEKSNKYMLCATGWFINLDFIKKVLLNEPGYTIKEGGGIINDK